MIPEIIKWSEEALNKIIVYKQQFHSTHTIQNRIE